MLRELSAPEIFALFFIGLLVLMVVLVVRAIRGAEEEGLESVQGPSRIQRVLEAYWKSRGGG